MGQITNCSITELPLRSGQRTVTDAGHLLSILYKDREYTDLIIKCCGKTSIPVHRSIVCAHSPFFKAACSNGFKESHERVISLPEDHPETVRQLVEFMYTFDCTIQEKDEEGNLTNKLLSAVRIYEIAIKYEVHPLKLRALEKFKEALKASVNEIVPDAFVVDAITEIFDKIPEKDAASIKEVLFMTNEGQALIERLLTSEEFRQLCQEDGMMAYSFLTGRVEFEARNREYLKSQLKFTKDYPISLTTKGTAKRCLGNCDGQDFSVRLNQDWMSTGTPLFIMVCAGCGKEERFS